MSKYKPCKLCSGAGVLPARENGDEEAECSDCEGYGVVEVGSEIQIMQSRLGYKHGARRKLASERKP